MKKTIKIITVLLAVMLMPVLFSGNDAQAAQKKEGKIKNVSVMIFDTGSYSYVERSGSYEGETKDGVPDGKGTFFLTNMQGILYTASGTFKEGVPDGDVTILFDKIEGYSLVRYEQNYKNGVIRSFSDRYESAEGEWYSYDGIKTGKGYYVIYANSEGYNETFHVNEAGETVMDSFDNLYLNNVVNTGFCGASLDIANNTAFKVEKMRNASKSSVKKKAKIVSGEAIAENPEKYEGKLIKLENAIMEDYRLYADQNDNMNIVFESVTFLADYYRYTLFFEPGTVKFKNGKVVDLCYVSFGTAGFMLSDGTYEGRECGWAIGKPSKSKETKATYALYRFAGMKYEEYSGTFCGPLKDGKPNGLGVFSYKIGDVPLYVVGSFYADEPLDGFYGTYLKDSDRERCETTYIKGEFTQAMITVKEEDTETGEDALVWTYFYGRTSDSDEIAKLILLNGSYYYSEHVNEAVNMPITEGVDVYYNSLNDIKTSDNDINTSINMYFTIDRIRQLPKKEIKKQASNMSVQKMLADIPGLGEEVLCLDNVKVIGAAKSEYADGKYFTEINASAGGHVFMFFADGKKSLKEGDVCTVYFTVGGTMTGVNEDGGEEEYILAYAYDVKKAK